MSKTSFDETDTSLGRIDACYILPPHNSISLKSHLSQAKQILVEEAILYDSKEDELNSDYMISILLGSILFLFMRIRMRCGVDTTGRYIQIGFNEE